MDQVLYNDLIDSGTNSADWQMFASPRLLYVGPMTASDQPEKLLQVLCRLQQIWSDASLTYWVTSDDEPLNDSEVQREVSRLGLVTSVHIRHYYRCRDLWHSLKQTHFYFTGRECKPLFHSNAVYPVRLRRLIWQTINKSITYLRRPDAHSSPSLLTCPAHDLANLVIWAQLNPDFATQIFRNPFVHHKFLRFWDACQRTHEDVTVCRINQAVRKILIGQHPIGAREYV